VDVPGRRLLLARVTLDGVAPGDHVGSAAVIVTQPDGRPSDFLWTKPFTLRVDAAQEDGDQRAHRPTVRWTVTTPSSDAVASTVGM
ncbi:MAG: hypothetical protein M3400_02135, partial [Actinomycetota bacterium]|nr:hypothetical protein [Actinomycetota bacterium]